MLLPKIPDVRTPTQAQVTGLSDSNKAYQAHGWWTIGFAMFYEKLERCAKGVTKRKARERKFQAADQYWEPQWECPARISGYIDSKQTGKRLVCVASHKFKYYINSKVYMYVRKRWPLARVYILPNLDAVRFVCAGKGVVAIMRVHVGEDRPKEKEVKL